MSTITFTCYSCNQVLRVGADKAGKKAKCVKCGTILTIPVAAAEEADVVTPAAPPAPRRPDNPPPPPRREADLEEEPRRRPRRDDEYEEAPRRPRRDDDYEDRPRRRVRDEDHDYEEAPRRRPRDEDDDYDRPRRRWGDWPKVGIGLTLNTVASGILIGYGGLLVLGELFFLISIFASSPGMLRTAGILASIAAILFFLQQIPALVGYVFGLFAPNKRGALPLAITVLSIAAVVLIFKIIWVLIPAIQSFSQQNILAGAGLVLGTPEVLIRTQAVAILLTILILLTIFSEYILYAIYLRSVSNILKERYIAGGTLAPIILASAAGGLRLIMMIIIIATPQGSRGMVIAMTFLAIIGSGLIAAFGLMMLRLNMQARAAVP